MRSDQQPGQRDFSGLYPIREFARLTGVNPVTLRAWERRYGILQPQRTDKGHRFYNDDDIQQVRLILYWLEQGYPIRQVKLLLQDTPQPQPSDQDDEWQEHNDALLRACEAMNLRQLDKLWTEGFANYPMAVYYQHCLSPVLFVLRPKSHLLYQVFVQQLKRKLACLVQHQQKHNQGEPLLMLTNHADAELELLAIAYALGAAAFRVEYLGHELNISDVDQACQQLNCQHLWLHFSPLYRQNEQQWLTFLDSKAQHLCFITGIEIEKPKSQHLLLPQAFSEKIKFFITNQKLQSSKELT